MCDGDCYELTCGHALACIRNKCSEGPCERPVGGVHEYLDDTCATCDPGFQASQVGRSYRKRQDEWAVQLTKALKARRAEDVALIHAEMESLRRRTNDIVGEAQHRRASASAIAADVGFPHAHGQHPGDGMTSRWEGGKCVWEREGPRLHRQPIKPAPAVVAPRSPTDPITFLQKALDDHRRRAGLIPAEKADIEDKKEGKEKSKLEEKPYWYREYGPVLSPRAFPMSSYQSGSSRIRGEPVVEAEDDEVKHQPLHPLRHKKKVASWLPTEEEMEQLAARLSDSSLQPETSQHKGDRKGKSRAQDSRERSRPNPRTESYTIQFKEEYCLPKQQKQQEIVGTEDLWICEAEREGNSRAKSRKSRKSSRAV